MFMTAAKEQGHILKWLGKIGLGTLTVETALQAYEDLCFTKCYHAAEFMAAEAEFVSALSFIKQQTTIDLQRLRDKAVGGLCTDENPRINVGTRERPIIKLAHKIDCRYSVSRSVRQLLCSQPADWPTGSIPSATRTGVHLDDVLWMHQQGAPWEGTMTAAVEAGWPLGKLLQLRQAGCPWDEQTMSTAVHNGKGIYHVMELRQAGCPWGEDGEVVAAAGMYGWLCADILRLQSVATIGCPWGEQVMCNIGWRYSDADLLKIKQARWASGDGTAIF